MYASNNHLEEALGIDVSKCALNYFTWNLTNISFHKIPCKIFAKILWLRVWTMYGEKYELRKSMKKTTIASNVFSQGKKWNKEKSLLELCTWTLIAIKKISTENCCSYSFSEKPALFIWFSKHDSHIPITRPVFKNILISIVRGDFPSIFYHLALKKRFTVSERMTKIANTQNNT